MRKGEGLPRPRDDSAPQEEHFLFVHWIRYARQYTAPPPSPLDFFTRKKDARGYLRPFFLAAPGRSENSNISFSPLLFFGY